jgi:hypothetical protein
MHLVDVSASHRNAFFLHVARASLTIWAAVCVLATMKNERIMSPHAHDVGMKCRRIFDQPRPALHRDYICRAM